MKSLVQFLAEARNPWKVDLTPDTRMTNSYYGDQMRIARKVMNMIGYKSTNKKTGKLEAPFYFDGNDCVSKTGDIISDKVFLDSADKPLTIKEFSEVVKDYIESNLSELQKEVDIEKVEEKSVTVNDLKAVSKETYEKLSTIFDGLVIGKRGGLTADYKSGSANYQLSFSEKDGKLTIRSSKNGGVTSPIASGDNFDKVIEDTLAKLKKWGIDLQMK